jgi:hypothetical protein
MHVRWGVLLLLVIFCAGLLKCHLNWLMNSEFYKKSISIAVITHLFVNCPLSVTYSSLMLTELLLADKYKPLTSDTHWVSLQLTHTECPHSTLHNHWCPHNTLHTGCPYSAICTPWVSSQYITHKLDVLIKCHRHIGCPHHLFHTHWLSL